MTHTLNDTAATAAAAADTESRIDAASAAFRETCLQQMDMVLDPVGEPRRWTPRSTLRGSRIELRDPNGVWTLAVACNELTAMVLTRVLFAMEIEDLPGRADLADALGELVNVAGGLFKAAGAGRGGMAELGLPRFMPRADEGLADAGDRIFAQRLVTPDELAIEVALVRRDDRSDS